MTPKIRYVIDGQSLVHVPFPGLTWPQRFMLKRWRYAESFVVGVSGTTYAERTAGGSFAPATTRVDPLLAPTDRRVFLISDGMESDVMAGLTAPQVLSAAKTYLDARRSAGADWIIHPTIPPASSAWYSAGMLNVIATINATLRADPTAAGADEVVDVAALPLLADPLNTDVFYDQLHFTALGARVVGNLYDSRLP